MRKGLVSRARRNCACHANPVLSSNSMMLAFPLAIMDSANVRAAPRGHVEDHKSKPILADGVRAAESLTE